MHNTKRETFCVVTLCDRGVSKWVHQYMLSGGRSDSEGGCTYVGLGGYWEISVPSIPLYFHFNYLSLTINLKLPQKKNKVFFKKKENSSYYLLETLLKHLWILIRCLEFASQ